MILRAKIINYYYNIIVPMTRIQRVTEIKTSSYFHGK